MKPDDVARILKVDISNVAAAPSSVNGQQASTDREQVDLSLYPRVTEELIDHSGDRSQDTYRIGCACRDHGLKLENFRWVIDLRVDLAGRIGARHDDDVLRVWNRVQSEWQAQMAAGVPPSAPPPYSGQPGATTGSPAPPGPGRFFGKTGFRALDCAREVMAAVQCGFGQLDERFYTYEGGVWTAGSGPIEKEVTRLLQNRYRLNHTANVATLIKYQPGCARITDAPIAELINVPNGMIRWETGDLLPHDPGYCSTVQLPVEYVPTAGCPLFEKYLREVLPAELVDSGFIWELLGYALYSGNPLHVAVLLFGHGRNGKGVLIRVLKNLLGEHNISTVSLHELTENKFRVATLYQKLANLAGDLDSRWLENTALFKKITGHDGLQGEYKYGATFEFDPWALPFYSANKAFGSPDSSEGWVAQMGGGALPELFPGEGGPDAGCEALFGKRAARDPRQGGGGFTGTDGPGQFRGPAIPKRSEAGVRARLRCGARMAGRMLPDRPVRVDPAYRSVQGVSMEQRRRREQVIGRSGVLQQGRTGGRNYCNDKKRPARLSWGAG